jgi:Asp-tRNA(Asn)/Glu-tRNA(Gln) amidotransferase A subunit family amidase
VPSSLCGVVGLKPTFGRTTNHGLATVGWSMESCGPIAATTEDALLVYAAMLGTHPNDRLYSQPVSFACSSDQFCSVMTDCFVDSR